MPHRTGAWRCEAAQSEDARPNPRGHGTTANPPAEHGTKTDLKKTTTRETRKPGAKNRLGRKYFCVSFLTLWVGRGTEKAIVWLCVCTASCFFECLAYFSVHVYVAWLDTLWASERVTVWGIVRTVVFVSHPVRWTQQQLLFPSPASASRTEACKDMHAFIFNVSAGRSVKSVCVCVLINPVWG